MRHQPLFVSRLALRRRPILYWTVSALVATVCAVGVGGLTARAEQAASRFGGLQSVAVVARPLSVGDEVADGDVRIVRVPRAFVPKGALAEAPVGRTVLAPLYPGEALLPGRLAPDGLRGVAALLPEGTLAMAVPGGPRALRLAVGDLVDLLATSGYPAADGATPGAGGTESTTIVASAVRVVDVRDDVVTVAVKTSDAPRLATALTQATMTFALSAG